MPETPLGSPRLPRGYRLDLIGDPDAPALRGPDGTLAARFAAGGVARETLEREALKDLAAHNPLKVHHLPRSS